MDRGRNLDNLQSNLDDVQSLFLKRSAGMGKGSSLNHLQNDLDDAFHLFNVRKLLLRLSTSSTHSKPAPIEQQQQQLVRTISNV